MWQAVHHVGKRSRALTGHDAGKRCASYAENNVTAWAVAEVASKALTLDGLHAAHNTCMEWLCQPSKGLIWKPYKT